MRLEATVVEPAETWTMTNCELGLILDGVSFRYEVHSMLPTFFFRKPVRNLQKHRVRVERKIY